MQCEAFCVSPPPRAHALPFFVRERSSLRACVQPAPSSISPSVQPLCPLCAFDSQQVLWSEVACCLLCYTWFCSNHGGACDQCGCTDFCAACRLNHACPRPDDSGTACVDVAGGSSESTASLWRTGGTSSNICRWTSTGSEWFPDFFPLTMLLCGICAPFYRFQWRSKNFAMHWQEDCPQDLRDLLGHEFMFCVRMKRKRRWQ